MSLPVESAEIETSRAPMPSPELNAAGKTRAVRAMFAEIAPSYDRLNHLLSINVDRLWRRFTVGKLKTALERPGALALDLCCGTADLTLELEKRARVIGCDFCHPMLVIGHEKIKTRQVRRALLTEGDALRLPFADCSFDVVTIAFGLRNLEHVEGGLAEIMREVGYANVRYHNLTGGVAALHLGERM